MSLELYFLVAHTGFGPELLKWSKIMGFRHAFDLFSYLLELFKDRGGAQVSPQASALETCSASSVIPGEAPRTPPLAIFLDRPSYPVPP